LLGSGLESNPPHLYVVVLIGYLAEILGMARRYINLSNCGTACNQRIDSDDVEIAATIVIARMKHRWGSSTPGHKTYKRDREGADKKLNAQYFVEHPIYNADHFHMRCVLEQKHNFYNIVIQIWSK
jgi:hypothetical protein